MNLEQKTTGLEKARQGIFWILLGAIVLWPLLFAGKGIDQADTMFYLAHYKWGLSHPELIGTNTAFSDITGGLIYGLLPSHQLLVFRLLDCAVTWTVCLCIYRMVGRRRNSLLLLGMLAGSFFLKRYPMVLSYNSFSVLFLTLAMLALLRGLEKKKTWLIFLAGAAAGINVLYRLPNLLQSTIILAIPLYGLLSGWKWKEIWKNCLIFVLGYFTFLILGLLTVVALQGADQVLMRFADTARMGADSSEDNTHNLKSMLVKTYVGLRTGMKAPLLSAAVTLVLTGTLGFFGKKLLRKPEEGESRNHRICLLMEAAAVLTGLLFAGRLLYVFWQQGAKEYGAACGHAMASACLVGAAAILLGKHLSPSAAVLGLFLGGSVFYMALGTDNSIYHFAIYGAAILGLTLALLQELGLAARKHTDGKFARLMPCLQCACLAVTVLLAGECLTEGAVFLGNSTYMDQRPAYLTRKVRIEELAGMKTTPEKAEMLESFYADMQDPVLKEYPLVTTEPFCSAYVITDNEPYFDSLWPSLQTYSEASYARTIERREAAGELPIIVTTDLGMYLVNSPEKNRMLRELMQRNDYECISSHSLYEIFVPGECFERLEKPEA